MTTIKAKNVRIMINGVDVGKSDLKQKVTSFKLNYNLVREDTGVRWDVQLTIEHDGVRYGAVCDRNRHLICEPYNVMALHVMAAALGIGRSWFHGGNKYLHYDIPKKRVTEIKAKCRIVRPRDILKIIQAGQHPMSRHITSKLPTDPCGNEA